ncbi:ABC transporter ATP-binding protein [Novispirillum sp. DQ9]|uniref:ABC transporter ATP-binding protein n=1 Tax=Novispirillum sp. DQ9 TaxID=3398612 RepID=UPI003C79E8D8
MRVEPIRPTKVRGITRPEDCGLALEHVSHAYGDTPVVRDVSFAIAPGEFMCLLGPSGCGKTTTLRIAAGLEVPAEGTVWIGGVPVAGPVPFVPPERRSVGFLFQDYALFPHLKVLDNVTFGIRHLPAEERRARAMEALERVGMAGHADSFPHMLSGGQQQRVGLARALAPRPRLMLLDEPFSGLDKRLRDQVRDETLHVLKETGISALLVTHDPEEAMFMADVIALMQGGRIVQMGTPVELYCKPRSAFAARFFGEVNQMEGRVRQGHVQTPFGPLEAPGVADGGTAQVLIRPEALALRAVEDGAEPRSWATVLESRMLGRTSLIHMRATCPERGPVHLHSRMPGQFLPPPGEVLEVVLDPSQAFVYPVDGAAASAG